MQAGKEKKSSILQYTDYRINGTSLFWGGASFKKRWCELGKETELLLCLAERLCYDYLAPKLVMKCKAQS